MICYQSRCDEEIKLYTRTFNNNSFPIVFVQSVIRSKITNFNKSNQPPQKRCPVYLRLPLRDNITDRFAQRNSSVVQQCYFSSNTQVIFSTKLILVSTRKDVFPSLHNLLNRCGSYYIGRIIQRLDVRFKQNVPTN